MCRSLYNDYSSGETKYSDKEIQDLFFHLSNSGETKYSDGDYNVPQSGPEDWPPNELRSDSGETKYSDKEIQDLFFQLSDSGETKYTGIDSTDLNDVFFSLNGLITGGPLSQSDININDYNHPTEITVF